MTYNMLEAYVNTIPFYMRNLSMPFGFSRFWNQFPEDTEVQLAKLQTNVEKHVQYCQLLEKPRDHNEMSLFTYKHT